MLHRPTLLSLVTAVLVAAQQQPPPAVSDPPVNVPQPPPAAADDPGAAKPARIEGVMLDDRFLTPLRRGYVILRPKGLGHAVSGETDASGKFVIPSIEPGEYTVEAQRAGYLSANWGRRGGMRMPALFRVYPGQEMRDLTFRLERWGAIEGTIRFADDAEPAMGVVVTAYRKQYARGRLQYVAYGSAQSNDRGDYRISGLASGAYIVAAIYNKPVRPPPADGDPLVAPDSELSYATTFFASAQKLSDAIPLRIEAGRERELPGIDIFLGLVHSLRVRVEVNEGCAGGPASKAILQMYRLDENDNPVLPVNADIAGRDNLFMIRGLGPGSYLLTGNTEPPPGCAGPLRDRRLITVSDHPVDDVKLTLVSPSLYQFSIKSDAASPADFDPRSLSFHLEPRSGLPGGNITLEPSKDHADLFYAMVDSQEDFNVVIDRKPLDAFLKAPFTTSGTSDISIGTHGATVFGSVLNDRREPIAGATVTLIPDPAKGRFQYYAEAYSNEQGLFGARGVAPGKYIAIPWLDVPPCDFQNWENLDACRRLGTSVTVNEGDSKSVELVLNINN